MSFVAICERGTDGSEWRARPEQYEAILHAFESGRGVVQFTNMDGAEVTARVRDIVAVVFMTDDAIAARDARMAVE